MENEVKVKEQKQNEEKSFASINIKSFATVAILLVVILAICGAMSYFIPQGYYQMAEDGKTIIDGTYQQLGVQGIEFWRVLTAPFRVFVSDEGLNIVFICLFLLIMSGVFNLLEKTGGIRIFISKIVQKFSKRQAHMSLLLIKPQQNLR